MGDNNKFFENKKKFFENKNYSQPQPHLEEKKPEQTPVVENKNDSHPQPRLEEKNINNTNYLELDKEKKENLKENGLLFKHGTVDHCNILNFRTKQDKLSDVIHTFNCGDEILYAETDSPDWFIVKDKDGKIGYCMSEFIKIEQ